MPRASTPESKSPSTPTGPPSAARPRIGFSIDFLVGTGGNNNKRQNSPQPSESLPDKKTAKEDVRESTSPVQSVTPDSSRSASPNDGGNRIRRLSGQAVPGPGSPLFQSWNPASVIPAGHPPPYLDMAALANLRQLYEQQQQQHPAGRAGFFPPHHPSAGSAFSPANFPPPPPGPPGQMSANQHGPGGMIRPESSLAAQQWWLLAQARQHQQRLFAAAAVASHRFPPGKKKKEKNH